MLVVIPFCARDKSQAVRLAEWIAKLGGVGKHDCLLAVHKDTDSAGMIEPLAGAFGRIAEFAITDEMIVEREQHTYAANLMWKRTVNHIADMNESQPFLWLESDCMPIAKGWLDAISVAYDACGKPFMHELVKTERGRSNSGCGVYPAKVREFTIRLWELSNVSWDIVLYDDFSPHTCYTSLIQDIGFMPDGKTLPTFPDQESLSIIRPEAVLFHRCKDGTLIDRLIERASGSPAALVKSRALVSCVPIIPPQVSDSVPIPRLIDMRGCDATRTLHLSQEIDPVRLCATAIGTPSWEAAPYEIRSVITSTTPGINAGDSVLFSRVERAILEPFVAKKDSAASERAKAAWVKRKAKAVKKAARKAKQFQKA